jgi:IclR family pca regulon transcriptional regulator
LPDESRSLAGAGRNESIRRAFQVLECLSLHPGASVAAVARATGLPRATVTRVLGTLADVGAARRDGAGWTLGPSIAALARGVDPPLAERAGPQLAALAADLGETVMLAVPEGAVGARVVAEAAGPRMVGVGSWLGRTLTDPASGFVRMRLATSSSRDWRGWPSPFDRATGSSACWRSTFRPRGLTPRCAGARSERYGRRLSP